jgi:perosamine synthetase
VYWLYSVLIDEKAFGMKRDALIAILTNRAIDTRPLFPPVHTQPIYSTGQCLPIAKQLAAQGISLPSGVSLGLESVRRVAQAIKQAHDDARQGG